MAAKRPINFLYLFTFIFHTLQTLSPNRRPPLVLLRFLHLFFFCYRIYFISMHMCSNLYSFHFLYHGIITNCLMFLMCRINWNVAMRINRSELDLFSLIYYYSNIYMRSHSHSHSDSDSVEWLNGLLPFEISRGFHSHILSHSRSISFNTFIYLFKWAQPICGWLFFFLAFFLPLLPPAHLLHVCTLYMYLYKFKFLLFFSALSLSLYPPFTMYALVATSVIRIEFPITLQKHCWWHNK